MSGQLTRRVLQFHCRSLVPIARRCYCKDETAANLEGQSKGTVDVVKKSDEGFYDPMRVPKTIVVHGPVDVAPISGIPEEHIKERQVRIYKRAKSAMQSGTENVDQWEIEFDTRERWENPLMGWSSSGDPHSNLKVQFYDMESAISYAEKNGWEWFLEPEKPVKPKVKSYGFNFSWNKRTRVSTK